MHRPTSPAHTSAPSANGYWKKTLRLTLWLLALWFSATFCVVYFARELDRVNLFGWPLSFYMAAQGSLLVYLAIVMLYTARMGRADKQFSDQTGEHTHGE